MGLKVGIVKIEKYNPNWELEFYKEKENLAKMFGDLAIEIEHIGSTAVKGLSAKPIIDIAVALKKLDDFEKIKEKFQKSPYSVKQDSDDGEILIRKGEEDNRTHFIHVMEINSKRYKNTIIFRNYLRKHEEAMKEYESLKKELARKYADNRKMYTSSKNEYIENIIKKAYKEQDV